MMQYIKANLKAVIIVSLLLLGLTLAVLLVQRPQIFRSRADVGNILEVTNEEGNPIRFEEGVFKTNSDTVKINLKPEALERLKN